MKIFSSITLRGLVVAALTGCSSEPTPPEAQAAGTGGLGEPHGGTSSVSGSLATGGGASSAGSGAWGGSSGGTGAPFVVALLQSPLPQAAAITTAEVADLVSRAVLQAGGLDFVRDGQTVVLKPNLPTVYQDDGETLASPTANGICTDWRVVKAVADLVRAKNPSGQILVMEGSTFATSIAFAALGYTSANLGSSVDELIALEGASCTDPSTAELEQVTSTSGKQYWLNRRYLSADVVISIPTLATDAWAGIGGAVPSMGIGSTPAGQYSTGDNPNDCTRSKIDRSSPETTGDFIRDYYAIKPADFVVVDGLQGLEHGPLPALEQRELDYASSLKNMRLVLAGRNAVAVDTMLALLMRCDPKKVPHLTKLEAAGLGTTNVAEIQAIGVQPTEVAKPFASRQGEICPGN